MNRRAFKYAGVILLASALAACGGGDFNNGSTGSSGGGNPGGGSSGSTGSVPQLGSGTPFVPGSITVNPGNIGSNTTATLSVSLVNADGSTYSGSASVTFSSQCSGAGTASITSPVTTSNGSAQTVYTPKGCSGQDTITATTTVDGTVLNAQGVVTVTPSPPASLAFISATPSNIGLQGSGQPTASTVVFQLLDSLGNPVPNQPVSFTLSTNVGGITVVPTSSKTDGAGKVSTVVQAGTVHTSVVVTASLPAGSNVPDAQSSALTISTGIPTENNFSISAKDLNLEAFQHDGVTDLITVHLADRFNNPVPDGTAVTFTTDGGQIQQGCNTTNGTCSVTWTSADPRPSGNTLLPGRVAILAYAVGEESFFDNNGNGVFDDGDTFSDIPEIFLDANEDGKYESGIDPFFFDFDKSGTYTPADGLWEGLLCKSTTQCGPRNTTGVGKQIVIVMSTDYATITPRNLSLAAGPVQFFVTDNNGNPMTVGSTFSISQPSGCTNSIKIFPATQPETNGYTDNVLAVGVNGVMSPHVAPQEVDISGLAVCPATFVVTSPNGAGTALTVNITP